MSLPRFFAPCPEPPVPGGEVPLDAAQARHLAALRLQPGAALELVLPQGPWRADLASLGRDRAVARLAAPLTENREPAHPIHAWLPVPAHLTLLDDMLAPVVELGATRIHLVAYQRSEHDPRRSAARMERWERIVLGACEQSHRTAVPALSAPVPFDALLAPAPGWQRWVAYELPTGAANPRPEAGPFAFTSGPEGGITEAEYQALSEAGWLPVSLGASILRAVTCPTALLGAYRFLTP